MPSSPPRQCSKCRQPVPYGQRCPCVKPWSSTGRTASSSTGSTRAWRRLRAAKLAADPICEHPGCRELADTVDHKTPVAEGGAQVDWDNVQSLCTPHHKAKTARESARGRLRGRQGPNTTGPGG